MIHRIGVEKFVSNIQIHEYSRNSGGLRLLDRIEAELNWYIKTKTPIKYFVGKLNKEVTLYLEEVYTAPDFRADGKKVRLIFTFDDSQFKESVNLLPEHLEKIKLEGVAL